MNDYRVHQQEHGYRNGHQLLASSVKLPRDDQDTIDRLSDMAGPLSPGEIFSPYLTTYPLPSRDFYVVARTWQDFAASRAGCVLTRSILTPMSEWETTKELNGLLALLLRPIPKGDATSMEINPCSLPPPIVHETRVVELFEMVFFEKRQPIVFFDTPEAEAITVRFLTALWPSLRRNFATCTFTLAPRKIEGRYFDLVFAPKTASARFSGSSIRRIEANSSKPPQHHWTEATTRQIFQSDSPNLVVNDVLGVLTNDKQGNESALRLVLLWNELATKAESTPTAVLGMLDILNSQTDGDGMSQTLKRLTPVIVHAVNRASGNSTMYELWRFLIALLGKYSDQSPPKLVLRAIKNATAKLSKQNPEAVFGFLVDDLRKGLSIPDIIFFGIGKGLSSSELSKNLPVYLEKLSPDVGLRILAVSSSFTRSTIKMLKAEPELWIPCFVRLFESSNRKFKSKVRSCIIPLIDDCVVAPLLPHLLEGTTARELVDSVIQIGNVTKFEISEFDEPIANAANNIAVLETLRNTVAAKFCNEESDRFLLCMLCLNAENVAWICGGILKKNRARRILTQLLEAASDSEFKIVQRHEPTCECSLKLLLGDPSICTAQIVRILIMGMPPIEQFLEINLRALPLLEPKDSDRIEERLLERALTESDLSDERVPILIAKVGGRIESNLLVEMATATSAPSLRVGENITYLEATSAIIRDGIVSQIYNLSDRLTSENRGNLGERAYKAWATMIKDTGTISCELQLDTAILVLPYALRLTNLSVSTLIVVSFPIVYSQLSEQTSDEEKKSMPIFYFPLGFIPLWGQKKSTRYDLVRDLVDAFLTSLWPPADLLLTAIEAGIEKKVVNNLRRKYKGNQYIKAIELDSERLKKTARKKIQNSLIDY